MSWGLCPEGFATECASLELPLDWSAPKSKTIGVFASRQRAAQPATRDLWLLTGGPGESGASLAAIVPELARAMPDTNVYVLEQRGIGNSAELDCPTASAADSPSGAAIDADEWPSCLKELESNYGRDLEHFTTTATARDLEAWMGAVATPDREQLVYGVSYGTYLALRFLQLFPDGADGVILDSVLAPTVRDLSSYDEQFDPVARELAELCRVDEACSRRMGDDPWATATNLLQKIEAGHCAALDADRATISAGLAELVMFVGTRPFLFPVLHRLERCNPADVEAITTLSRLLMDQTAPVSDLFSPVLRRHILYSELWSKATTEHVTEKRARAVTWPGLVDALAPLYDSWPRYQPDELVGEWPTTNVPLLALNGSLDPQTPIEKARAIEPHLHAETQTFVEVPYSPHVTLLSSPVMDPDLPPCGFQMLQSFVESHGSHVDRSCLDDLRPIALEPTPAESQAVFGTRDPWGDTP